MSKVWAVTNGEKNTNILGLFSRESGASSYRELLVARYQTGSTERKRADDDSTERASFALFGPELVEAALDEALDSLPGAWSVRVDESCRMVACNFNLKLSPRRKSEVYHAHGRYFCGAYGPSPQEALAAAVRDMQTFLASPRRRAIR